MSQLESPFSPNLGPVTPTPLVIARGYKDGDSERRKWSWQQTIIFALIASTGLWGLIFWAIRTLLA
jgi:hypothetical protein